MGLYSTNRASTVAAESTNTEAQVEEVNLEGVEPDYGSVMETVIQLHECDRKMFETLIEGDFMEATNNFTLDESTAMALNEENDEAKKAGIGSKIKKAIEFVIEKIKQAVAALVTKFEQVFKTDAKLIAKYKEAIGKADFAKFNGIKNFACPKEFNPDNKKTLLGDSEYVKALMDKNYEECKKVIDAKTEYLNSDEYKALFFNDSKDTWKPEGDDVKAIISIMDHNSTIKKIKAQGQKAFADAKKLESDLAKDNKDVENASFQYKIASEGAKFVLASWNAYRAFSVEQLKAARKAFIILGRFALAGKKGEEEENKNVEKVEGEVVSDEEKKAQDAARSQEEAAIDYILGDTSDVYIESVFGY